jgi:hypothetical protein
MQGTIPYFACPLDIFLAFTLNIQAGKITRATSIK